MNESAENDPRGEVKYPSVIINNNNINGETAENTPRSDTVIEQSRLEKLYSSNVHKDIRQFGYKGFAGKYVAQQEHIGVGDDYEIGPGDELHIFSVGGFAFDKRLIVDVASQIHIEGHGSMSLLGVLHGDLSKKIQEFIETKFVKVRSSVVLSKLRMIKIDLIGMFV